MKMNMLSLFSGIGAFEKALTNIGIDINLINFCEIDKYAIQSYCAIHEVDKKLILWCIICNKNFIIITISSTKWIIISIQMIYIPIVFVTPFY